MELSSWLEQKREDVRRLATLDLRAITPTIKDFTHAVVTHKGPLAVIAEITRATPEEGRFADVIDPDSLVKVLDDAAVAAIAVPIDPIACFAQARDLTEVASRTTTPVIARDLVVSRQQVYLARLAGADALLLTAAAAPAGELKAMLEIAASMHLAAPIEVRSEEELNTAVAVGARLAVVPAFRGPQLDLSLPRSLLPRFPRTLAAIVRGPFARPEDFAELRGQADGIWLAGPLMQAADKAAFLSPLVEAAENG
ncbi:MAG: hypothetical protein ACOZIN_15440 [Myxococcota bacterium]